MLLKVKTVKNVWFATIGFLTMDLKDSVCNGCHDLPMFFLNVSDIDITTIENIFVYIYIYIFCLLTNMLF